MVGRRIAAACLLCKKVTNPREIDVRRGRGKYCSLSCASLSKTRPERNIEANKVRSRALQNSESYKIKRIAHDAVSDAVKAGALIRQPCEICGVEKPVEAHHDDYAKPLDVRWLCVSHHRKLHRAKPNATIT